MLLINLPEEIVVIIIKKLDFKSQVNLYHTCRRLREIVCLHNVIKVCKLSLNTLATARSLKLHLFKDISNHLIELNLCGVPDLCKSLLLPPLKRLKNLRTLNVAYTYITIEDLPDIHATCTTLKDIVINFIFIKNCNPHLFLRPEVLKQYQSIFENFENVHFVSIFYCLYIHIMLEFINTSNLNKVTFAEYNFSKYLISAKIAADVIQEHLHITGSQDHLEISHNHISLCNLCWNGRQDVRTAGFSFIAVGSLLRKIDTNKYVIIIILTLNFGDFKIFTSPIFKEFFNARFGITVENYLHCDYDILRLLMELFEKSGMCILAWNIEKNKFDDEFFDTLFDRLKRNFPRYFSSQINHELDDPFCSWFFTKLFAYTNNDVLQFNEPNCKRRRIALPTLDINYNKIFRKKQFIDLSLIFTQDLRNPVSLSSSDSNWLKKITYLSLSGVVRFSDDFFGILFSSCSNLMTLNVEAGQLSPLSLMLSRSLTLNARLKNLRLLDRNIKFDTIFNSLSKCTMIENIVISDLSRESTTIIANPILIFNRCTNLYSFVIEMGNQSALNKSSRILKKAKSLCGKSYLNVKAQNCYDKFYYNDPFLDVFRINPMKELL